MLQLSADSTFHYELLRLLGTSRDLGADIAEVLDAAGRIVPGDFQSWCTEFDALGRRARAKAIEEDKRQHAISARNAFFRAADFFLHGDPKDSRIVSLWSAATACFDAAIRELPVPGQRARIHAKGFDIPAVFYRAARDEHPRPTILMCNGYDGSQEEMLHVSGLAAIARGFNVVTFDGPGQPSVIREQGLTFIDEWENVLAPVIDWCVAEPRIDASRLGLLGYSFGGWLIARAAAREHRITALACVDGIFDAGGAFFSAVPAPMQKLFKEGNAAALNAAVKQAMAMRTNLRWAVQHGCWVFGCATPFDFLQRTQSMTLAGIVDDIACPVLVCDAVDDEFFKGQPATLAKALGARATHKIFTQEDSASAHCHVGTSDLLNSTVLGWFEDTLAS